MYYATLRKIESTHNNLRTEVVNGLIPEMPVVGNPVFMYSGEVLTENTNMRHIYTSVVKEVRVNEETGEIVFRTQNSTYALTNIRLADPAKEGTQHAIDNDDDCG